MRLKRKSLILPKLESSARTAADALMERLPEQRWWTPDAHYRKAKERAVARLIARGWPVEQGLDDSGAPCFKLNPTAMKLLEVRKRSSEDSRGPVKRCRTCGDPKPLEEFHPTGRLRVDGTPVRGISCKDCERTRNRERARQRASEEPEYREKQRQNARTWYARVVAGRNGYRARLRKRLRDQYQMTLEQFDALLARQGDRCAICQAFGGQDGELLVIDHSHRSGIVRGLLCEKCNWGIGLLMDDPLIMASAAAYVRETARVPAILFSAG